MTPIPQDVLAAYNLESASFSPIGIGNIHSTYKVTTEKDSFILQKQHYIFGKDTVKRIDAIAQYRQKQGSLVQSVIPTISGDLFVELSEDIWRLLSFIPGRVFEKIEDVGLAYEAGEIHGTFHRQMEEYTLTLPEKHHIHNTRAIFSDYVTTFETDVPEEIRDLDAVVRLHVPKLFLPEDLPIRTIHADPKISNIIFDTETQGAIALIDLDRCQNNTTLGELGDAFRSWCGALEDDPNNHFYLDYFEAAYTGYVEGSKNLLSTKEKDLICESIQLITLELAMRFLIDYQEDRYFGWDSTRYTSRKAHNLARAKGQIALFKDVVKNEEAIKAIVNSV